MSKVLTAPRRPLLLLPSLWGGWPRVGGLIGQNGLSIRAPVDQRRGCCLYAVIPILMPDTTPSQPSHQLTWESKLPGVRIPTVSFALGIRIAVVFTHAHSKYITTTGQLASASSTSYHFFYLAVDLAGATYLHLDPSLQEANAEWKSATRRHGDLHRSAAVSGCVQSAIFPLAPS
ncbi:hypothetical protein BT67DRAFT_433634 [Trichocladium antarcticum]|uniref:Uncharacterized protein n=1 Tax=Trichocladium antarcticum TaxID=1450529 RepID=A0AAN6UKN2_9PEZI|nr:hypothetical protein BT67DRAFT_433634 [Trichocladium antarcticum]